MIEAANLEASKAVIKSYIRHCGLISEGLRIERVEAELGNTLVNWHSVESNTHDALNIVIIIP